MALHKGTEKEHISDLKSSDLGRRSVRSGLINMGSQGVAVALQLLSTVVLARLLTPEAYGTIAMVAAVIAFASLFKDLGLSTATIQRKDLTHDQVSVMFWANLLAGLVLTLLLSAVSSIVADFYGRPELMAVTIALSVNIFLVSLGAQHSALLTRNMRFKELAICRLSGALTTFLVALMAALADWQHWALVAGTLSGSLVGVILLWSFNAWRPGRLKRGTGARSMLTYGLNLTGFDLVNYFSRNLDNILIGRVWGTQALGYYSRAYSLLLFPIQNIRGPITSVAMPAMSRLQNDPERFRSYYCQLLSILGMLTMPISAFCFVGSDLIIVTLLGPQWQAAVSIAKWLALASFLQPVAGVFGMVLMALGLANRHLRCGLVSAILLSLTFLLSVRYGVETLAICYALSGYVLFVPIFLYASKGTGICLRDFIRGVWRPALASVIAAAILYWVKPALVQTLVLMSLILNLGLFGLTYVAVFAALPGGAHDIRKLYLRLVEGIRKQK